MVEEIVRMALESGIWAAMFCFLFLYMLKDSREREKKYTDTLNSLVDSVKGIESVKADTTVIMENTAKIKSDCAAIVLELKEK